MSDWMSIFKNRKIFELTLPGTHNSSSSIRDYTGLNCIASRVCCQSRSITQQLISGIRAIDLRI